MKKLINIQILLFAILALISCSEKTTGKGELTITKDDGTRLVLQKSDLKAGTHHLNHSEIFGK